MDDVSWRTGSGSGSSSANVSTDALASINRLTKLTEDLTAANRRQTTEITDLKHQVTTMKATITNLRQQLSDKNNVGNKKVDTKVSKIVKELYGTLPSEDKFNIDETFLSSHNQHVKTLISSALKEMADFNDTPDSIITFTIRGRYTVEKKNLKNSSPTVRAANRVVARRRSLFETRLRVSKTKQLHQNFMSKVGPMDMSDLISDNEGETTQYIIKRPRWRTNEETERFEELDSFATLKVPRVVGTPSKRNK